MYIPNSGEIPGYTHTRELTTQSNLTRYIIWQTQSDVLGSLYVFQECPVKNGTDIISLLHLKFTLGRGGEFHQTE